MNHWLVKSEPSTYSWEMFVKEGRTAWTGVRNYQARNHMRAMKVGEPVLFYHSGEAKEAVGLGKVLKAAYADPTAKEGDWSCVDLAPDKALPNAVSLAQIKEDKILKEMPLVKNSRLSVLPLTEAQFNQLMKLAGQKT